MSYIVKYFDEYGEEHYFSDYKEDISTFDSVEEAKAKIKSILSDEFDIFGEAVTDYYVVAVEESVVEGVDYLTTSVDEDDRVIILSANKGNVDYLKEVENDLTKAGCKLKEKKEFVNGSVISELYYEDEKVLDLLPENEVDKEETDITVEFDEGELIIAYGIEHFTEVHSAVSALAHKYRNEKVTVCTVGKDDLWATSLEFDKKFAEEHEDEIIDDFGTIMSENFDIVTEE